MNKINYDLAYRATIRNMNRIFNEIFGDNVSEFKKLLELNHAVIFGSFITQCVLDEYWEGSDIDIFVPDMCDDLKKFLLEKMKFRGRDYDYFYYDNYFSIELKDASINDMAFYETSKYIIEISSIETKDNDLIKCLWNACDFDVCRNVYYIHNDQETLKLCAINDICTKTTKFKIGHRLGQTITRYYKYIDRGFDIECNIHYEDLVKLYPKHRYEKENDEGLICISATFREVEIFKISKINKIIESDDGFMTITHGRKPKKNIIARKNKFNKYKIEEGNKRLLPLSNVWNKEIYYGNGYLTVASTQNFSDTCRGYCPLFFCGSKSQHFHVSGIWYGYSSRSDFIFVIVD
jgi:hypothetical protein